MKSGRSGVAMWRIVSLVGVCLGVCGMGRAEVVTLRLGGAGAPAGVQAQPGRKVCYAVKCDTPPILDGKLSDEAWKQAQPLALATALDGNQRAPVPAEAKICRDDKNFYIAFHCTEPLMNKLQALTRSRDANVWDDDSVEVFLGVNGTYYHFAVNAAGSTYDGQEKKAEWSSGLRAAAASAPDAWDVEMSIPIAALTRGGAAPEAWTANFCRNRHTTGKLEECAWSPTYGDNSHVPERFGELLLKDPPRETVKAAEKSAGKTQVLQVLPAAGGQCLLRFDLSGIPRGAKIYRADLFLARAKGIDGKMDEANINVAVYPLFAEAAADAPHPSLSPGGRGWGEGATGEPLAIRGPWFDCLDATQAVDGWAGGWKRPNGGFLVKTCPFLEPGRCALEVAFEGKAGKAPAQAAGLRCVHRSGQTFITWQELSDPVGAAQITWGALSKILDGLEAKEPLRHVVYRHTAPITAGNLGEAERIASVRPASCWNVNGRNIEQPMDAFMTQYYFAWGHWDPFWDTKIVGKLALDCPIGRFVIEDGGKPLPPGAGLYVHTADKKGKFYYAVVSSCGGAQNTMAFSRENSLADGIEETPADPQPVLQGELPQRPYWNYPEKRLHYVQWVAPPLGNLPSQYYNWSVGVPNDLEKNAPVELSLHRGGYSYYRTQYRIERNSLVLAPYDFPLNTWWYGYHESAGTLKSFRQGVIHNYTEERLLAFIKWACRNWPADRNRITVTCMRGEGASGGLHLAVRHPDVFNLALLSYAYPDYKAMIESDFSDSRGKTPPLEKLLGKVEWNVKADTGRSVWDELNLTRIVKELPATTELPLITTAGTSYKASERDFFLALLDQGQPLMVDFNMWGAKPLLISQTGNWSGMADLDVRKNLSLPAFKGAEADALRTEAGKYGTPLGPDFRWDTKDLVDEPARYEITLRSDGRAVLTGAVTLRRLQKFKVEAGKTYAWEFSALTAAERGKPGVPQKGAVTVGGNGLLTIPGLFIPQTPGRLVVQPK